MTPAVYLCEAAGFFVQLFPCALLCFLAFDSSRLRLRPRRLYPALLLTALALSALFPPALYGIRWWRSFTQYDWAANLYMLAVIALAGTAFACTVRESAGKKVLVLCVALLYAAAVYWLVNLLSPDMPDWNGGVFTYSPWLLLFYAAVQAALFPLLCLFMRRQVSAYLREISPDCVRSEALFAAVSTAAFMALMAMADAVPALHTGFITLLFLFLIMNQALFFWMLFTNALLRTRRDNARRALEIQKLQYDSITADMERAARMRHDMRHHCGLLYTLAKNGSLEEVTEYLSALVSQTESLEEEVFCADPTVNALLQYYAGKARDGNIACQITADCGGLTVSPEDLTVLLGNALENALAACRRAGGGRLEAAIGVIHGSLTVVISNTCLGVRLAPGFVNDGSYLPAGALLSHREGGGRGLESIDAVARKYGGSAGFRFDERDREFTTRIILNCA